MVAEDNALGLAVVIGATGGIGGALVRAVAAEGWRVTGLARQGEPPFDLLAEADVAAAAAALDQSPRLIIVATGFLHDAQFRPERSWRELDPVHLARAFAVNAIGPALVMKHFLPRLPREGRSVFAVLSAKVGSIGDNHTGGWYSYRASKAALNQMVRTAAVELKRRAPEALCVALHPGTVDTGLSQPFARSGLEVVTPDQAAVRLVRAIDGLTAEASGGFYDYRGQPLPW